MAKNNPFMPFIEDFEKEAENFLIKYGYEDAIENPQPIDIREIISKRIALEIIDTEKLSPDYSVQGIIAFSEGIVEVFDMDENAYVGHAVEGPAILIDCDLAISGYSNNILAHEAFHWYKHRHYFIYRNMHNLGTEFAFRCDKKYEELVSDKTWSDEQKMEWQARKIAPMILMPRKALINKVYELSAWQRGEKSIGSVAEYNLINKVAEFFSVTPYSVAKRMTDLGYLLSACSDNVYISFAGKQKAKV
ncbi:MAG: hypothetical protein IJZ23_09670 [Roseburia sp.]|nr:hypothetical protein [Roseburia sp.]